jgi:hypothetical protein
MLRYHELRQNPVSVTFRDGNGATITVCAERLRRGLVKITCQCQRRSQAGWCQHCLAVFSDREVFKDKKHRETFERIVGGTSLEEAATELTKALDAFAVAYRHMKFGRPSDLDPGQLRKFADQADQANTTAGHLALALEEFIKESAAATVTPDSSRKPNDPAQVVGDKVIEQPPSTSAKQSKPATSAESSKQSITPDLTSASLSKAKETALEMIQRALEKDLLE